MYLYLGITTGRHSEEARQQGKSGVQGVRQCTQHAMNVVEEWQTVCKIM
jgi:hypothetical protein